MSPAEFIVGLVYVLVLFGSFSYVMRSRYRRFRKERTARHRNELAAIFPFWLVGLVWTLSLFLATLLDMTEWGEMVRQIAGWVTFGSLVAAAGASAADERMRNMSESEVRT